MSSIIYRKFLCPLLVLGFIFLFLGGCAQKSLFGPKEPGLAIKDAQTALLKAAEQNAAAEAPSEMEMAQEALNRGEELLEKYKRRSGGAGAPKAKELVTKDDVREKALYAKLYAQTAQAVDNQKKLERQLNKTEAEIKKYESVKKEYQAEEAKVKALIVKKQKLKDERRAAEIRAREEALAKEKAQRQRAEAEAAQRKAEQEALAAKQQLQEMQNKLSLLSAEFARVKAVKRGLVITLSGGILFDVDKTNIRPAAKESLAHLAKILKEYPGRKIIIEGHTDNTGPEEYNQGLSEKRAVAVMDQLISQGLDRQRMDAKGFGMSKPLVTNETSVGRQQNRRVELVILNPDTKN